MGWQIAGSRERAGIIAKYCREKGDNVFKEDWEAFISSFPLPAKWVLCSLGSLCWLKMGPTSPYHDC